MEHPSELHPFRFTQAVGKLYKAFHDGTLDACDCRHCAVGNILDNTTYWRTFFGCATRENPHSEIISITPVKTDYIINFRSNGYSGEELAKVECVFLDKFIGFTGEDKEAQFHGLCAVVEYLCELDGIPNVMDFTKLFETENYKPKYELYAENL